MSNFDLDLRPPDQDLDVGKQSGAERTRRPRTPGRTTLVEAERWPAASPQAGPGNAAPDHAPNRAQVHAALRSLGAGSPLAPALQADYGARLGVDLGAVRVHTGNTGARDLGALAFTHGAHVAVAPEVDLQSPAGEHVLAHELVHVAQNLKTGGAAMQLAALLDVGPSDSPVEQEAEAGAAALRAGLPFQVAARGTLPGVSLFHRGPTPAPSPGKQPSPGPSKQPSGPGPQPTRSPSSGSPGPSVATPVTDGAVAQELERRADPAHRAGYDHAIAQVDILRIQSLQYSFSETGLSNMLLQSVWPWQSVKDHALQISSNNPYPSGSLQAWISGTRAVIRILGDLASWIGTIGDIVATVSGLLALITAETVIGGALFAAIAEIAASAGTIAGLIKIVLDLIDALLGIVQILLLVQQINESKDPNQRAVLAAELASECNQVASTLTTLVVEAATLVVTVTLAAGIGSAFAKGLKSFRGELKKAFFDQLGPRTTLKGLTDGWAAAKRQFTKEAPSTTTDAKSLTKEQIEGGAVVYKRVEFRRHQVTDNFNKLAHTGKAKEYYWVRKVLNDKPILSRKDLPKRPPVGDKDTKIEWVYVIDNEKLKRGLTKAKIEETQSNLVSNTAGSEARQGAGLSRGKSAESSGGVSPPDVDSAPVRSSLSHVDMWPSMLTKLKTARQGLPSASSHVMEQYNNARDQAGPGRATAVEQALGATRTTAGQLRFKSVQQETDATAGAANSQRGADAAQAGQGKDDQRKSNQSSMDGQFAKLGGQKVEPPKPKPSSNLLEEAKDWLVDHTIGQLGKWTAQLQNKIAASVGHWAMAQTNLNQNELDMAGVDDSMRTYATKDNKSAADAKKAQDDAAKVDPVVAQLMQSATKDQQLAIQGMVDSQEFLTAIDEAGAELDETISNGSQYIQDVTPIIRRELEVQRDKKTIDAQYVAAGVTAAAEFQRTVNDSEDFASAPANAIRADLQAAQQAWPDLNIGVAVSEIDLSKQRYLQRHQAAGNTAIASCQREAATLNGLIGTTDYGGVTAALHRLDMAMDAYDLSEVASAAQYASELETLPNACLALINDSLTLEQIEVPADDDHLHGPK